MHGHYSLPRDPRIDVLRGFALLTIFIDHVPDTFLASLTLRNFGFADAAELFVVLAGYSAMMAYGRRFARDGVPSGLCRIGNRCVRLYIYQAVLLALSLVIVTAWNGQYDIRSTVYAPFVNNGAWVLAQGLVLRALPPGLDILPLYIILLAFFPAVYLGLHFSRVMTLIGSGLLWLAANCMPWFQFTNVIDGQGWFFNPFAWQFLFVIGAATVMEARAGSLPKSPRLEGVCWTYLALGLLAAAPWSTWGVSQFRPIAVIAADKTNLSLFRLLHVLCLIYLVLSSARLRELAQSRRVAGLEACGKHSLEIFSLGTLLSLGGALLVNTFGTSWQLQAAVDAIGIGCLIATAKGLEKTRLWQRRGRLRDDSMVLG